MSSSRPAKSERLANAIRSIYQEVLRGADGTRTHDLLHGKQSLNRGFPGSMRDSGRTDSSGLPAITVGLGNEWVTDRAGARGVSTSATKVVEARSPQHDLFGDDQPERVAGQYQRK